MVKNLPFYLILTCLLSVTVLSGYSSGAAATTGRGYTGAPSAGSGTEGLCGNCHNGGPYGTPGLNVTFDDGQASELPEAYRPGQTYTVSVAVTPATGEPVGYGFQAQFLDADNQRAGELLNPAAGVQITGTDGDRSYAEQNRRSPDSTFTFEWTAPAAGSGPVRLYVVGNSVNGSGGTSGDNGSPAPEIITLSEGSTTSLPNREVGLIPFTLAPNPTSDLSTLTVDLERAGEYTLSVYNVVGRVLQQDLVNLTGGRHALPVDVSELRRGVYLVKLEGNGAHLSARLMRR